LHQLGYRFAAYPLTLLSAAMKAISEALSDLRKDEHPGDILLEFDELRRIVGFDDYYSAEKAYSDRRS
jgi:2-methylisocitrate lyase-like PEP mutase family enzyme